MGHGQKTSHPKSEILLDQSCSVGGNGLSYPLLPELLYVGIYLLHTTKPSLLKKDQELALDIMFKHL